MNFTKVLCVAIAVLLFALPVSAAPSVLYDFDGEKIIKVMDFPNTSQFQSESGQYVDAGYIFKQVHVFFIPLWNYDGRWVGYINDKNYLEIDRTTLEELAQSAYLTLPDEPMLPVWDMIGGKLVLLLLAALYVIVEIRGRMKKQLEPLVLTPRPNNSPNLLDDPPPVNGATSIPTTSVEAIPVEERDARPPYVG